MTSHKRMENRFIYQHVVRKIRFPRKIRAYKYVTDLCMDAVALRKIQNYFQVKRI